MHTTWQLFPAPDGGAPLDAERLMVSGHPLHRRAEFTVGGARVRIRPVLPQDATAVADHVRGLSPRSSYLRFHSPVAKLTATQLAGIVDVDHHDRETLVAEVAGRRGWRLVGLAQYVRLATCPDHAEIAVLVADGWQGRGIGRLLAGQLGNAARECGIAAFTASVLAENRAALHLAYRTPHTRQTSRSGPVLELDIPLASTA